MLQANTDPENGKINPGSKGLNATSSKYSRLFLVSYPTCPYNFMEICSHDTDFPETWENNSCMQGVERNIPKMFPVVHCVIFDLSRKFHVNPFSRFPVMLLGDTQTHTQTNQQRWNYPPSFGGGKNDIKMKIYIHVYLNNHRGRLRITITRPYSILAMPICFCHTLVKADKR